MHARGILHRDIQLANCVMGLEPNQETLYMIDFGFSKFYIDQYTRRHIPDSRAPRDFIGNYWFSSVRVHCQGRGASIARWPSLPCRSQRGTAAVMPRYVPDEMIICHFMNWRMPRSALGHRQLTLDRMQYRRAGTTWRPSLSCSSTC